MQVLGPEIHSHGGASQPPDRIRQDILYRLRWSILWSVEEITIESGLNKDGTEKRQPFLSHPLAMESLADPPVIRLQLSSVDLYEAKHFYILSESYSDEPVVIENTDGRPITFTDFVTEAHKYLSQHKDALVLCRKNAGFSNPPPPGEFVGPSPLCAFYTPIEHNLFFKSAFGVECPQGFIVDIGTFMEGERGRSAEAFWKSQREMAAYATLRRASRPNAALS
ncbi:hypothetical protein HBI06_087200 [Parastagonospora nodorum]|nr:hypothetical protein HBI06_087200 [Parastagonospora nodorum]KAH4245598.1 hypothetical protein HBI05_070330 [Parastagonospora nodorum]KAH5099560.1 hypothetical protein HBH72_109730 [Parastagonospora nodorum]KAH5436892.1 hypothetical protein HBI47_069030 [Parastagonospora nodorum]KAH6519277.1 hypothetical protein HBI07_234700 [Parastagonospora nodorum]